MEAWGKKILDLRTEAGWTQERLAEVAGISKPSVQLAEAAIDVNDVGAKVRSSLATAFGMTHKQICEGFKVKPPKPRRVHNLDPNVSPYSEVTVPEIPTLDMPIAAGPWMELGEAETESQTVIRDGRFRILIRGDSMEKTYPNESMIEFIIMRPDFGDGKASRLEVGKDYYVQRAESATFKRLDSFSNESLTFIAINKRKYPNKIEVLRQDIVRMEKAMYILKEVGR